MDPAGSVGKGPVDVATVSGGSVVSAGNVLADGNAARGARAAAIGAADIGAADIGAADIGAADIGAADIGAADIGAAASPIENAIDGSEPNVGDGTPNAGSVTMISATSDATGSMAGSRSSGSTKTVSVGSPETGSFDDDLRSVGRSACFAPQPDSKVIASNNTHPKA